MNNLHSIVFLMGLTAVFLINGCGQENTAVKGEMPREKSIAEIGSLATAGCLLAPETEAGAAENNEGVGHFKEGHWQVSEKHFRDSIAVNPELAEAHYNLALTLDKLGNHGDATNHFRTALDLTPDNPKIKDSKILKDHLEK